MKAFDAWPSTLSYPRALVVGSPRQPHNVGSSGLLEALAHDVEFTRHDVRAPLVESLTAYRAAARAIRAGDAEIVHLFDARLAVAGLMMQRHLRVPVSVTVSPLDLESRSPWANLAMRAVRNLDLAFVPESAAHQMRIRAPHVPLSVVPPAASVLPWPSKRRLASVRRALGRVQAGRLIVAMPWPQNRNDLRWFRDFIQPQLVDAPLCLLLGVPSRREARLLLGATGSLPEFRILTAPVDADTIAAVARCVDAFVAPSRLDASTVAAVNELTIALSCSGLPLVTNAVDAALVLAHERSGFLVDPGDDRGFVQTLNAVLALPAIQRQALGAEFARFALERWSWAAPAAIYAERFATLVGRPQIPLALRAA